MNSQIKIIKDLAKEIVYGQHRTVLLDGLSDKDIYWQGLASILFYHELSSFLYIIIKDSRHSLPESFVTSLRESFYEHLCNYMNLYQEMINIVRESKKENILVVPIKGLSFAEKYYQRFGFRPLSDIDLLVKEDEYEKEVHCLGKLGYHKCLFGASEEYWRRQQCHVDFIKETENLSVITEVHWQLDLKKNIPETMPRLWDRLKETTLENEAVFVLSYEDTLLSLALHQRRYGKVLNMKYICDAGMILKQEPLDWEYIFKTAKNGKMESCLYFLLYQTQFVLDCDMGCYLRRLNVSRWKRVFISWFTRKYMYSPPYHSLPYAYLMSHLFLYDSQLYPLVYILKVPREQFAKFYSLPLNTKRTLWLYRVRYFYSVYRLIMDTSRKAYKCMDWKNKREHPRRKSP